MPKPPKPKQSGVLNYMASTGRLSGREIKAKKRLDDLVAKYVADGMAKEDATDRARNSGREAAQFDPKATRQLVGGRS